MTDPVETKQSDDAAASISAADANRLPVNADSDRLPVNSNETVEVTDPINDFPYANQPEPSETDIAEAAAATTARANEEKRLQDLLLRWTDGWKDTLAQYIAVGDSDASAVGGTESAAVIVPEKTNGVQTAVD